MALAKSLTTTWHVPADKSFVGFPLCPGTYFNSANLDIKIDWGDGQEDEITDSGAGAARTVFHKYDAAGDKVITVYGGYGTNDNDRKIAFPSFDDRAVSHFGPSRTVSTMERLKKVTTWENFYMHGQGDFKGCTMLTTVPWNFSNFLKSTDPATAISFSSTGTFLMNSTFEDCTSFTSWLSWDVSDCTSMNSTFKNAQWATGGQGSLGNWNVSNVTDMSSMLEGSNYNNKNISKWKGKLSKVQSMSNIFRNCAYEGGIGNDTIGDWFSRTHNPNPAITDMSGMFSGSECKFGTSSTSWTIVWWNMTTVQDTSDMFRDNQHAYNMWLKNWFNKTSGVTYSIKNMSGMFAGSGTKFFYPGWRIKMIKDWDMRTVEDVSDMFRDNQNVNKGSKADGDLSKWFKRTSGVTYAIKNMSGLFAGTSYGDYKQREINLWDMRTVENISEMFKDNSEFDWNLSEWFKESGGPYVVTDMSGLFENSAYGRKYNNTQNKASLWTSQKTSIQEWDMSSVESTARMFKDNQHYAQSLYKLLDGSPTGGVSIKNISGMFENSVFAYSLPWKLNTCEDISRCFAGTAAFNGNITDWFNSTTKSANLKNISSLFEGNTTYNTEGIKHWKLPMVENASGMFKDSTYNKSLWGISLPAATDTSSMFENSQFHWSLETLSLKSVIDASYMFRNSAYDRKSSHFFPTGSKIKYMDGMFSGANCQFGSTGNPTLHVWDTSNVVSMSEMFKGNTHFDHVVLMPGWKKKWDISNVVRFHDFSDLQSWTVGKPNFTATSVTYDPAKPFGMFDLTSMTSLSGRVTLAGTGVFDELTLTSPATDIPGAVELGSYDALGAPTPGSTQFLHGSVELDVTSTNIIDWTYTPDHTANPGQDPFIIYYTDCNKNEVAIPVDMGTWKPVVYTDPTASIDIDASGWSLNDGDLGFQINSGHITVTDNIPTLKAEGQVVTKEFIWQIGTKDSNNNYTWTDFQTTINTFPRFYPGTTYYGNGNYLNCIYKIYGQDGRSVAVESATKPLLDYFVFTPSEVTSINVNNLPVNGLPTLTSATLEVDSIASNKTTLENENQAVTEQYKWYIDNAEASGTNDQSTYTITGDGAGDGRVVNGSVVSVEYKLLGSKNGTNNTKRIDHTVLVEPALGIISATLSANHAQDPQTNETYVLDGDTYIVDAVIDANGSAGHADPSKPVNADSETYLWEHNDGSGWSNAPGVNDQSQYSFVADVNTAFPGDLRVTYTITNESDSATTTLNLSNIVVQSQPSPYDYTVELLYSAGAGTYEVRIGTGQYPNPQTGWDETDTMYDAIASTGGTVTKTIDLTQPASLGKNLGLTIDPRGYNGDYTGVAEYTNGVTIVNDILTIEIDPVNTPSLWLYDKAATTELEPSNDRGIKGKYFYHVPWQDASGQDTRGFMPAITFTGDTTGPYDSGEVDIDVSVALDVDFWLMDVSIGGNAPALAGMTQDGSPAGVWTKADNGRHYLNFSFKYTPDSSDEPSQDFEFTVFLISGDGDSNTGSAYEVTASLGTINISAGSSWVWNDMKSSSYPTNGQVSNSIHLFPVDYEPNGDTPYTGVAPVIDTSTLRADLGSNLPSFGSSTQNPFGTWDLADHDLTGSFIHNGMGVYEEVTVPSGKWYKRVGHNGSEGNKYLALIQLPQDSTGQWYQGTGGSGTPCNTYAFAIWEIDPDNLSGWTELTQWGPLLGGLGNYTGHSPVGVMREAANYGCGNFNGSNTTTNGNDYAIQASLDGNDFYGAFAEGDYEGCTTDTSASNYDPLADHDNGNCTAANPPAGLPATVDITSIDPSGVIGALSQVSTPLTMAVNPDTSVTKTFYGYSWNSFTTNLFYTATNVSAWGSTYQVYLAYAPSSTDYMGNLVPAGWTAGDDGGNSGDFSQGSPESYANVSSGNTTPVGDYDTGTGGNFYNAMTVSTAGAGGGGGGGGSARSNLPTSLTSSSHGVNSLSIPSINGGSAISQSGAWGGSPSTLDWSLASEGSSDTFTHPGGGGTFTTDWYYTADPFYGYNNVLAYDADFETDDPGDSTTGAWFILGDDGDSALQWTRPVGWLKDDTGTSPAGTWGSDGVLDSGSTPAQIIFT